MNAAAMPQGVAGVFEMVVRATGRQDGFLYVNAERDYRDQRNLSVVLTPGIEAALAVRLGGPPEQQLIGRTIAVRGVARKTRIDFRIDGRPTGKYYFQTQLRLATARDMTVDGERAMP